MPAIVRGGGGISRKSDGEIFEDSIPAGITCETISVLYNAMWVENVKVFNGETSNSIYKGEVLLSDKKSTVSQYSTSRQVRFTKKACSFKTDISIADIREFIVKLGTFVYDISFGKNYYGLTRKVYVQLFDKNENRVDFFDDGSSASCHLLLDIQNGVIKEIAFGTGSSADHKDAKTKYAFSVKVNTVSRSIIDATAVPGDVASGKVFYGKNGRQVGTTKMIKKQIITLANDKTYMSNSQVIIPGDYAIRSFSDSSMTGEWIATSGSNGFYGYALKVLYTGKLLYVSVNGEMVPTVQTIVRENQGVCIKTTSHFTLLVNSENVPKPEIYYQKAGRDIGVITIEIGTE